MDNLWIIGRVSIRFRLTVAIDDARHHCQGAALRGCSRWRDLKFLERRARPPVDKPGDNSVEKGTNRSPCDGPHQDRSAEGRWSVDQSARFSARSGRDPDAISIFTKAVDKLGDNSVEKAGSFVDKPGDNSGQGCKITWAR